MTLEDDPAAALEAARAAFEGAAARFTQARAAAWAEWADDRVARIVTEQYAVTARLTDDALRALQREASMAIAGRSALMASGRPDALGAERWETNESFDARSVRAEIDAPRPALPEDLVPSLARAGYDAGIAEESAATRSARRLELERRTADLVAAAGALSAAADRARRRDRDLGRQAALQRWTAAATGTQRATTTDRPHR